ncbi:putative serine/threonine-protein phosphatase with EF-hands [Plasmopara halstedii]
MSAMPSPTNVNCSNEPVLRLHPCKAPPLHMKHNTRQSVVPSVYLNASNLKRTRMSPRHVKLQRMIPTLPYTIANPLRDQVSTNFRHELFYFHQLLQDAIKTENIDSQRSVNHLKNSRILDLLTSDRGDAILNEFFIRCQRAGKDDGFVVRNTEDDGAILWDVFETLFSHVPLIISEVEFGVASSPKAFCRYTDSLNSLRDLLLVLLFKRPLEDKNDLIDGDSDNDSTCGLQSSFGLGFGLDFHDRTLNLTPRNPKQSLTSSNSKRSIPMYIYCQQLERELETLRRQNVQSLDHDLGDVGLMDDTTVTLLLGFYALPHKERLAMFCQIASQANEQDAIAILHMFLDNCTSSNLLQIWENLRQSPDIMRRFRESKCQTDPENLEAMDISTMNTERKGVASEYKSINEGKFTFDWKLQGEENKLGRPPSSSEDVSDITEVSDFEIHGGDDLKARSDQDLKGIRERDRLSMSSASDLPLETQSKKRSSFYQTDQQQRSSKASINREDIPLLEVLHHDLTEVTNMKVKPDEHVMRAVQQLLERLDGKGTHDSNDEDHLRLVPASVQSQHILQQTTIKSPRASMSTALSNEQQFLLMLDQLKSLLLVLTDVHIHKMSTETITGAYRRMQVLSKLFAVLMDKSFGAAGAEPISGSTVNDFEKAQIVTGSPHVVNSVTSDSQFVTSNETMREDVEAMSQLLVKLSKFVRSLAPLVDNKELAPSSVSSSDDVLMIMDLATKLEQAGTLVDVPVILNGSGGGIRRLSLAADRELPVLLAVQSLARSSNFDLVSQKITSAVDDKLKCARLAVTKDDDEEEDEFVGMEGDEVMMRIVSNVQCTTKETRTQECQDQIYIQSEASFSESDDAIAQALRINKGDLSSNNKNGASLRGGKLFSVDILLRFVNQLYRDNYEGMASMQQYGHRRMEFGEFVYYWHIRKYGLKALAQRHLLKLIQSLRKHEKKVFQCQLCLRFLGAQISFSYSIVHLNRFPVTICRFHELKFVLGLLSRWSLGTFSGTSKHRVELSKRQFKIRISSAILSVQEALRERFGIYSRRLDALAERIRAKACSDDGEFIRESDLLTLCIEEFESQRALIEKVLGAVYQAGDVNGDGSLEFDEFASVVTHLSPTVDDRFIQKIFEAAHDVTKPPRISFTRFLDVVLLERVLCPTSSSAASTGIVRAKNATVAAGASASSASLVASSSALGSYRTVHQDEQEEAYQLELLCETWTHDREAVTQVLQSSITHLPTAKSLSFRVAFLDQLLDRRVDAKTAWLCHRQIMREIARYQHLDVDQIAGLRQKDQQFKKAVRAIQNAQRISALFSHNSTPVGDESDVEGGDTNLSYSAAVQLSLDTQEMRTPDNADVIALENELRDTFLERADEGTIDDYMAALQRLRLVSVNQELESQSNEEIVQINQSILLDRHENSYSLTDEYERFDKDR